MRKNLFIILFISFIAACLITISYSNIVRAEEVDDTCAACEIDPESQECLESKCIQRGASWYKEEATTTATGQSVTVTEYAPDPGFTGTAGTTYSYVDEVTGATVQYSSQNFVPGMFAAPTVGSPLFNQMYGTGYAAMAASGQVKAPTAATTWGYDTQTASTGNLMGQSNYSSVSPNSYMLTGLQMLNSPTTFGMGLGLISSQINTRPNISGFGTTGFTTTGYNTGSYYSPTQYSTGYNTGSYYSPTQYSTGYNTGSYYAPTQYSTGYNTGSYYAPTQYSTGYNTGSYYSPTQYSTGYNTGSYYAPTQYSTGYNTGYNAYQYPTSTAYSPFGVILR